MISMATYWYLTIIKAIKELYDLSFIEHILSCYYSIKSLKELYLYMRNIFLTFYEVTKQ
jgi:hypothetical protein